MNSTLKYLSFLYTLPSWHFSPAVKITTPFEVNVYYALHWNKKVVVETYNIKPGMAQHIANWDRLEKELQEAAEANSKNYLAPGEGRGSKLRPEGVSAYDDIHDQWKSEVQEKQRQGW